MNVFYNRNGVGDVLLGQVAAVAPEKIEIKTSGDVTLIFDQVTGELAGFNIFHLSNYVEIEGNGQIDVTEELLRHIQEAFRKNGVETTLEVDLSPKFVVGHVLSKEKHPNADKLSVCQVDVGTETLQIVCGAPNVEAGQKVVVAKVGAVMPSGLLIKDAELRGVKSSGMICSAKELDLPNAPDQKGILVLEDGLQAGEPFNKF